MATTRLEQVGQSLQQSSRVSAMRVRKRNIVEGRLLSRQLNVLEQNRRNQTYAINRGIYGLNQILRDADGRSRGPLDVRTCYTRISRPVSGMSSISSDNSLVARWKEQPSKETRPKCRFGSQGERCRDFPCVLPLHYSPIGQGLCRSADSGISSCSISSSCDSSTPSAQFEMDKLSVRRPQRFYNNHSMYRERVLRLSIEQIRERNQARKPIDWNTNYGQSVSLRRRNNVAMARPSSADF